MCKIWQGKNLLLKTPTLLQHVVVVILFQFNINTGGIYDQENSMFDSFGAAGGNSAS